MPKQETNHTELLEEEIEIPEVSYEGEDSKLLELVGKFKKGTLRIIIFTLVGAAMGWFSYTYTTDSFFITKVIFAVPYKISEAIYVSVIGTGAVPWYPGADMWGFTEFFSSERAGNLSGRAGHADADWSCPIRLYGIFYR